MRRRWRRREDGGDSRRTAIDAGQVCEELVQAGVGGASALTPLAREGAGGERAVLASGNDAGGERILLAFSPQDGLDALLAVLAVPAEGAARLAVAPRWSLPALRLLEALRPGTAVRALVGVAGGDGTVSPAGRSLRPAALPAGRVVDGIADPIRRELFGRAVMALEGLAAKHGGGVRGSGDRVELVVLARTAAVLRDAGGVALETTLGERSTVPLGPEDLSDAMDRLEGALRKRLSDRRARGGEEGLRAQLAPRLAAAAGGRALRLWPLGGAPVETIDFAAVGEDGTPLLGAVRDGLSLDSLAEILAAALGAAPGLPGLLSQAAPPVRFSELRIALAARHFDAAALAALEAMDLPLALFDIDTRVQPPELRQRTAPAAGQPLLRVPAPVPAERGPAPRFERPAAEETRVRESEAEGPRESRWGPDREPEQERQPDRDLPREAARGEGGGDWRAEEISVFDLEEETRPPEGGGGGRRRRRGRRRGRRGGGGTEGGRGGEGRREGGRERGAAGESRATAAADDEEEQGDLAAGPEAVDEDLAADEVLDDSDTLALLDEGAPDLDEASFLAPEPAAPEDEEEEEEPVERGEPQGRRERWTRGPAATEEEKPVPQRPRRRAAIVALADRRSLVAAVLLARDLRLLEGIWVYPQSELMTFFRGVATDLGEETPIYVVGLAASPAREALQAAALYRGRITWFDHHDWPPEDLENLRRTVGESEVFVTAGAPSPLAAVLRYCSRRSRFSDKLVELCAGRFSEHDYERWGRLWWHRLGEIAARSGERRADLEPLLVGRPSELARSAAGVPQPPTPPELDFVASRDFRLVHFGGHTLVVVPTPPPFDAQLAARIARERYGAPLSLAFEEGSETLLLSADERGPRNLEVGPLAGHVAAKHEWIEHLPDEDRTAVLRVADVARRPERLDEVLREIAMGRSLLEG